MESTVDLAADLGERGRVRGLARDDSADPAAEDAALVEEARAGKADAFDRLYRRHARTAHGVLVASVPAGEVDDLLQDVFHEAFRHLGDLRDARAFAGWLLRIARNRAADFHRSKRPTEPLEQEPEQAPPQESEALAVLKALRALPVAYRETLALRLVEGMTGPEIATRTGLTAGSVRVNLHRGMRLLRRQLGGRSGDA